MQPRNSLTLNDVRAAIDTYKGIGFSTWIRAKKTGSAISDEIKQLETLFPSIDERLKKYSVDAKLDPKIIDAEKDKLKKQYKEEPLSKEDVFKLTGFLVSAFTEKKTLGSNTQDALKKLKIHFETSPIKLANYKKIKDEGLFDADVVYYLYNYSEDSKPNEAIACLELLAKNKINLNYQSPKYGLSNKTAFLNNMLPMKRALETLHQNKLLKQNIFNKIFLDKEYGASNTLIAALVDLTQNPKYEFINNSEFENLICDLCDDTHPDEKNDDEKNIKEILNLFRELHDEKILTDQNKSILCKAFSTLKMDAKNILVQLKNDGLIDSANLVNICQIMVSGERNSYDFLIYLRNCICNNPPNSAGKRTLMSEFSALAAKTPQFARNVCHFFSEFPYLNGYANDMLSLQQIRILLQSSEETMQKWTDNLESRPSWRFYSAGALNLVMRDFKASADAVNEFKNFSSRAYPQINLPYFILYYPQFIRLPQFTALLALLHKAKILTSENLLNILNTPDPVLTIRALTEIFEESPESKDGMNRFQRSKAFENFEKEDVKKQWEIKRLYNVKLKLQEEKNEDLKPQEDLSLIIKNNQDKLKGLISKLNKFGKKPMISDKEDITQKDIKTHGSIFPAQPNIFNSEIRFYLHCLEQDLRLRQKKWNAELEKHQYARPFPDSITLGELVDRRSAVEHSNSMLQFFNDMLNKFEAFRQNLEKLLTFTGRLDANAYLVLKQIKIQNEELLKHSNDFKYIKELNKKVNELIHQYDEINDLKNNAEYKSIQSIPQVSELILIKNLDLKSAFSFYNVLQNKGLLTENNQRQIYDAIAISMYKNSMGVFRSGFIDLINHAINYDFCSAENLKMITNAFLICGEDIHDCLGILVINYEDDAAKKLNNQNELVEYCELLTKNPDKTKKVLQIDKNLSILLGNTLVYPHFTVKELLNLPDQIIESLEKITFTIGSKLWHSWSFYQPDAYTLLLQDPQAILRTIENIPDIPAYADRLNLSYFVLHYPQYTQLNHFKLFLDTLNTLGVIDDDILYNIFNMQDPGVVMEAIIIYVQGGDFAQTKLADTFFRNPVYDNNEYEAISFLFSETEIDSEAKFVGLVNNIKKLESSVLLDRRKNISNVFSGMQNNMPSEITNNVLAGYLGSSNSVVGMLAIINFVFENIIAMLKGGEYQDVCEDRENNVFYYSRRNSIEDIWKNKIITFKNTFNELSKQKLIVYDNVKSLLDQLKSLSREIGDQIVIMRDQVKNINVFSNLCRRYNKYVNEVYNLTNKIQELPKLMQIEEKESNQRELTTIENKKDRQLKIEQEEDLKSTIRQVSAMKNETKRDIKKSESFAMAPTFFEAASAKTDVDADKKQGIHNLENEIEIFQKILSRQMKHYSVQPDEKDNLEGNLQKIFVDIVKELVKDFKNLPSDKKLLCVIKVDDKLKSAIREIDRIIRINTITTSSMLKSNQEILDRCKAYKSIIQFRLQLPVEKWLSENKPAQITHGVIRK